MSDKRENNAPPPGSTSSSASSIITTHAAVEKEARTNLTKPPPKETKPRPEADDFTDRRRPSIPKSKASVSESSAKKKSLKVDPALQPLGPSTSKGTSLKSGTLSTAKETDSLKRRPKKQGQPDVKPLGLRTSLGPSTSKDQGPATVKPLGLRPSLGLGTSRSSEPSASNESTAASTSRKKVSESKSGLLGSILLRNARSNQIHPAQKKSDRKSPGTRPSIDLKTLLETPLVPGLGRSSKVHPDREKSMGVGTITSIPWKKKRKSQPELVRRRPTKDQGSSGVRQTNPAYYLPEGTPTQISKSVISIRAPLSLPVFKTKSVISIRGPLSLPVFKVRREVADTTDPDPDDTTPRPSVFSVSMDDLHRNSSSPSIASLRSTMPSLASTKPSKPVVEALPKVKYSAMSLFLKGWRNQEITELVIVPDPYDLTELVQRLNYHTYGLQFCVWFGAIINLSLLWYGGWQLPTTYASVEIQAMFWPWPHRYYATIYEFIIVPYLIAFYSMLMIVWPIPRDWGCGVFGCNRWVRWVGYILLILYLFAMTCAWIWKLSSVPRQIEESMDRDHLAYPNNSVARFMWNATQIYFRCCGKHSFVEWQDARISSSPKVMHQLYDEIDRVVLDFYPPECCDFLQYTCIDYPQIYEVWQAGCLHRTAALAMMVLVIIAVVNFAIIGCAIASAFFLYVMETVYITAKEVPEPVSDIDWTNTIQSQADALK